VSTDEILIEAGPGETRIALMEGGRLRELMVARPDDGSVVGNVYVGRVERVLPGIAAAFVDVGLPRAGFLGLAEARPVGHAAGKSGAPAQDRIADYVSEGDAVLVQVQRDAVADKGVKLTTHIGLTGRALVLLPGAGEILLSRRIMGEAERERLQALLGDLAEGDEGLILRTAGMDASAEALGRELETLRGLWRTIQDGRRDSRPPIRLLAEPTAARRVLRDEAGPEVRRIAVEGARLLADLAAYCREHAQGLETKLQSHTEGTPLFETFGVEEQIEAALAERVALPSRGSLIIQPTAALTAIDVNTGGRSESGGPEETALATNLEAAIEIARQLRLRNLSGMLMVDFVPMRRRPHQTEVLTRLRSAVADDRLPTHVFGFSPLGVVEMTRPRHGQTLAERLCVPCPDCAASGRVKSPATVAAEILRRVLRESRLAAGTAIAVAAPPSVVELLRTTWSPALAEAEERLGAPLRLDADAALAADAFKVMARRRTEEGHD
jgi:ribonuclease G